jgi:hypothetical protein
LPIWLSAGSPGEIAPQTLFAEMAERVLFLAVSFGLAVAAGFSMPV